MAKQSFTVGQVLTAAQLTSLQQTAMGGGAASAKTASYTLVAADAGTTISMTSTSATTITVNTGLFAAGDTVFIQNLGAGVSTITPGTATVNTSSSLALAQYEGGTLFFTSASASLFFKADGAAAAAGGKVLQVVSAVYSTETTINGGTFADTGLTLSITPTLATSKIYVVISQLCHGERSTDNAAAGLRLQRDGTTIYTVSSLYAVYVNKAGAGNTQVAASVSLTYLDSPATTSSVTYKTQGASIVDAKYQFGGGSSTITLLEIGA